MSYPPQGLDKASLGTLVNQAILLARLTADRAGYLDNINQAGLLQLTAVRAGYLDEIPHVEGHLHNRERWFGKSTDQSGNNWGEEASLTPYRVISGNGAFGTDTDDEAKVLGTDDTPAITNMTRFDPHRIVVTASSKASDWVVRIIYGTGTMAAAESAGQYTDVMVQEAKKGQPIDIMKIRCVCGSHKVWAKAKNANNNATLDFFIGTHEYLT